MPGFRLLAPLEVINCHRFGPVGMAPAKSRYVPSGQIVALVGVYIIGSDNGTGQTRKTAPVSGESVHDIFLWHKIEAFRTRVPNLKKKSVMR